MSKLFRSNRSQAVRLPKDAEFPADVSEVDVVVEGNTRRLVPKVKSKDWAAYFASRSLADPDFLNDRLQGEDDEREPLD
jgi:antitoxin VapB